MPESPRRRFFPPRSIARKPGGEAAWRWTIGQAIQYGREAEEPFRARHRFFEARFQERPPEPAEHPLSWVHIDKSSRWFRHESHAWAVRTLLSESEP
jgi:hypothetical protein